MKLSFLKSILALTLSFSFINAPCVLCSEKRDVYYSPYKNWAEKIIKGKVRAYFEQNYTNISNTSLSPTTAAPSYDPNAIDPLQWILGLSIGLPVAFIGFCFAACMAQFSGPGYWAEGFEESRRMREMQMNSANDIQMNNEVQMTTEKALQNDMEISL